LLAIIPAFLTITLSGDDKLGNLLVLSQVVLSLQLGFAVIPLIHAVSNRQRMREFAIGTTVKLLAWVSASIIVFLNLKLVTETLLDWRSALTGHEWVFNFFIIPLALFMLFLLVYITFQPIFGKSHVKPATLPHGLAKPLPIFEKQAFRRIAICIDFSESDLKAIAAGISQGLGEQAEYYLLHVVETAGARVAGDDIEDFETDSDAVNLRHYAENLRQQGHKVTDKLGFGSPRSTLPRLVRDCAADLVVMGSHGHRGLKDLIYGETVSYVQHNVEVPVLVV
jgi:manganese transport protein